MPAKLIYLTDLCDLQGGTQPPKAEWEKTHEPGYIRMLQIRDFTQSKTRFVEYVKDTGKLKTCSRDDILLGRYGASLGKVLTGLAGAYNVAIMKVTPKDGSVKKRFLYYQLMGPRFQSFLKTIGSRAAQAGFNQEDLSKFQIPVPPLAEQASFIEMLDDVTTVFMKRREQIVLTDHYLQSIFLEMFGDPVTNPKKHKLAAMVGLVEEFRYGTSAKSGPTGLPVLRIPNITGDEIDLGDLKHVALPDAEKKRLLLKDGDILFVRTNGNPEYIGRSSVFNLKGDYVYASYLIRARLKSDLIDPIFLISLLRTQSMRKVVLSKASTTAGQYNINTESLGSFKIMLPPLSEQLRFRNIYDNAMRLKKKQRESLAHIEGLSRSLLAQYFA